MAPAAPAPVVPAPVARAGRPARVRRRVAAPVGGAGGRAGPSVADAVAEAVVAIVAEMTGYPPELLDLDLDLEADLGVDTVKQAEVFAAVRERFGVERDEHAAAAGLPDAGARDRLGAGSDRAGRARAGAAAAGRARRGAALGVAAVAAAAASPAVDEVTEAVVSIVAEMTGYRPELLDLDLDLEADLGVDTVKQAEVFAAVRERFGVERDEHAPAA